MKYIGIDIGETWIKGKCVDDSFFNNNDNFAIHTYKCRKVKNPLSKKNNSKHFLESLVKLISLFDLKGEKVDSIGISTLDVVNYHGTQVITSSSNATELTKKDWKLSLEHKYACKVSLINYADAATIGLSILGKQKGDKTIGIMSVGNTIGFSIWKNGRRWRSGKTAPLFKNKKSNNFNSIINNYKSTFKNNKNIEILKEGILKHEFKVCLKNLIQVIETAFIMHRLDEVIICGELVDNAKLAKFDLKNELLKNFNKSNYIFNKKPEILISSHDNNINLLGALALAEGELIASNNRINYAYETLNTEVSYNSAFQPEKMSTEKIIQTLWESEEESGEDLKGSLAHVSKIVDLSIDRIEKGGRIIYVGAGTSGRIAALDAVEIPCTFGFPNDRILTLISGGISDAAIEIESNFEEDASSIPEMLLLNLQPTDVVIGISASGSAYYVQSALAYAKAKGALTTMIQANDSAIKLDYCDHIIFMNSGRELIAGSTRMKAGTATKKIINFYSTTLMIKLGKVMGSDMIDIVCTNDKLIHRAQKILKKHYGMDANMALASLYKADMHLGKVIKNMTKPLKDDN